MKKYDIKIKSESGIYTRDDSYYLCLTLRNSTCEDSISVVTDATMNVTIRNPCGTVKVNNQSMTHSSSVDGIYTYCYEIPSTALYGEWEVDISAPSDCAITWQENFFILPFNLTAQIRRLLGADAKKIDDHELAEEAWYAYIEVRDRVLEYNYREKLCCCVDGTCSCCGKVECDCICGTSSPVTCDRWKLKNNPIADFNNDDNIHGCECDDASEDCQNDICCIWKDSDGECHDGAVKVNNASCGEIQVYQDDCVTAIPSDNEGIFVSYYSSWRTFTISKFKKAIAYLAAYEIALKYNMVTKIEAGCDERSKVSFADRLYIRYRDVIDSMSKPNIEGVR